MLERLNIVYVADIPQKGGASASLFELVTRLRQDYGVSCSVLFASDGPLKRRLDDAGAKTFVIGHRGFLVSRPSSGYKIAPKFAIEFARYHATRRLAVRRAESFIDFSEVDLIHSNLPRNDLGLDLAKRHGIPHVCHLREFSFEDFECWSYKGHPVEYLNAGTDCFIAVSQACAEAWIQRGVDPGKVRVVHDGIDVETFARNPATPIARLRDDGKLRIVFLGGFSEAKGVWDAVEAMRLLPPFAAGNVTLDIYGYGSASARREVERYLSDNHLEGRVALRGECGGVRRRRRMIAARRIGVMRGRQRCGDILALAALAIFVVGALLLGCTRLKASFPVIVDMGLGKICETLAMLLAIAAIATRQRALSGGQVTLACITLIVLLISSAFTSS